MSNNYQKQAKDSTLAALLKEKPKRGQPPHEVSRQNVYVALSDEQKEHLTDLADSLPETFVRADIPDMAIMVLATRMEGLRRAVAGRTREIPEGITDLESLYLLWDLPLPEGGNATNWTSIRVSPQQAIDLGRINGIFSVLFGATRSEVFSLALALLTQFVEEVLPNSSCSTMADIQKQVADVYL